MTRFREPPVLPPAQISAKVEYSGTLSCPSCGSRQTKTTRRCPVKLLIALRKSESTISVNATSTGAMALGSRTVSTWYPCTRTAAFRASMDGHGKGNAQVLIRWTWQNGYDLPFLFFSCSNCGGLPDGLPSQMLLPGENRLQCGCL